MKSTPEHIVKGHLLADLGAWYGVHGDCGVVEEPELGWARLRVPLGVWGVWRGRVAQLAHTPAPAAGDLQCQPRTGGGLLLQLGLGVEDDEDGVLAAGEGDEAQQARHAEHGHHHRHQLLAAAAARRLRHEVVRVQVSVARNPGRLRGAPHVPVCKQSTQVGRFTLNTFMKRNKMFKISHAVCCVLCWY